MPCAGPLQASARWRSLPAAPSGTLGRPVQSAATLSLAAFDDIVDYEPSELVLTAKAATPLATIEAAIRAERQMLAFEPADYAPLLGTNGSATLGGALACNLSGPRRIKAGAARDHFLGVHAVSGRGERFKAGGRVVKNVTGYDVCKLLAGSYGTLALMHEVTVKVLPAPERTRTVLVYGLEPAAAVDALGAALGSAHEVSGAAHMPAEAAARSAVSYVARRRAPRSARSGSRVSPLRSRRAARRCVSCLVASARSRSFTRRTQRRSGAKFGMSGPSSGDSGPLWRLSVPPASGAAAAARVADAADVRTLFDWGGGLVWLAVDGAEDAGEAAVRAAATAVGGHATLVRADAPTRAARAVFQPQAAGLAALAERIKRAFDPAGVLNPGRMYAGV